MRKILLCSISITTFIFTSCSHNQTSTQDSTSPTKPKIDLRKEIENIVVKSDCSKVNWKNRGYAPTSYINGMAIMYAKQYCGFGSNFIKPTVITGSNSIGKHNDALKYYGLDGGELTTYTFLIGLGMRESSGRYCVGRDMPRGFDKSDSAEAGLFQMAYVARVFNSELKPLYEKYKNGELSCELKTFDSAAARKCKATDKITWGSGEGAKWQELMKRCPAASAAWAAILIRSQLKHFGPIKRKEVEFKTQCKDMLKEVEKVTINNCDQLK